MAYIIEFIEFILYILQDNQLAISLHNYIDQQFLRQKNTIKLTSERKAIQSHCSYLVR